METSIKAVARFAGQGMVCLGFFLILTGLALLIYGCDDPAPTEISNTNINRSDSATGEIQLVQPPACMRCQDDRASADALQEMWVYANEMARAHVIQVDVANDILVDAALTLDDGGDVTETLTEFYAEMDGAESEAESGAGAETVAAPDAPAEV